jgi:membrane-associated protease RseP (regulator of RpoE activity)
MGGWRLAVAIVAGLALLGAWAWAWSRGGDATPAAPGTQEAQLEALRAALEAERERGRELAAQVEWLRLQVEELARSQVSPRTGGDVAEPEAPPEKLAKTKKSEEELWFNSGALLANGVPAYEVERLQGIFDASEMELLDLRHQATREGWLRSGRYRNEVNNRRARLREEIGDESFDLLLYATGRNNRVLITDVLGDSPGERAGFRPGDVVVSYDGERVFKPRELQRATTQGRLGDRVVLEVLRDGEIIRLSLARGPVGVKLKPTRLMPPTRW